MLKDVDTETIESTVSSNADNVRAESAAGGTEEKDDFIKDTEYNYEYNSANYAESHDNSVDDSSVSKEADTGESGANNHSSDMVDVISADGRVIGQVEYNVNLGFRGGEYRGISITDDGQYALIHSHSIDGDEKWAEIIDAREALDIIVDSGNTELLEQFDELGMLYRMNSSLNETYKLLYVMMAVVLGAILLLAAVAIVRLI